MRMALGPSWTTEEAADGNEGVRASKERGYDLVVADELTEPYGAFGFCRDLKLLEFSPKVIILLERVQDTWLATWAGADRIFVQPVDPFQLKAAAEELAQAQAGAVPGGPSGTVRLLDVEAEEARAAEAIAEGTA